MKPTPFPEIDFRHITLTTPQGDIKGLFTDLRVDSATISDGLIPYNIRHSDDDDSVPATIERCVIANFFGTLIVREPLCFGHSDHAQIVEWNYS